MSKRLDVLLADYEVTREDDRSYNTVIASLFGLAVAVLGVILGLVSNQCGVTRDQCADIPQGVLSTLPLVPLTLIAYLQLLGSDATIRSYYMRLLERAIREEVPEAEPLTQYQPPVLIATFAEIQAATSGLGTGRKAFRPLVGVLLVGLVGVFGGLTLYIGLLVDWPWRLAMGLVYGIGIAAIVVEARTSLFYGRSAFERAARKTSERLSFGIEVHPKAAHVSSGQRRLLSYLVMPRPDDLIKAFFLPGAFVVGLVVNSDSLDTQLVVRMVAIWLVLELLIYQARYQWNDILDYEDDMAAPMSSKRGRLPIDMRQPGRNIAWSIVVIALRIYLVVLVASITVLDAGWPLFLLFCGVFGAAFIYQGLRWFSNDARFVGRPTLQRLAAAGVVLVVGVGYAIRGVAGFLLAFPDTTAIPDAAVQLAILLWVYGVLFVSLTWVLEGCSYCLVVPVPGDDSESASGSEPATGVPYLEPLDHKMHVKMLLQSSGVQLGLAVPPSATSLLHEHMLVPINTKDTLGADYRLLESRGRVATPWNVAAIGGGVSGAITSLALLLLAGGQAQSSASALSLCFLGLIGSLALVACNSTAKRVSVSVVLAVCFGVAGLLVFQSLPAWKSILLMVLPWLMVSATYSVFRAQSYKSLKEGLPSLVVEAKAGVIQVLLVPWGGSAVKALVGLRSGGARHE